MDEVQRQRSSAIEGTHIWGEAVVRQSRRMDAALQDMSEAFERPLQGGVSDSSAVRRRFYAERTLFLDAAALLLAHTKWVRELRFLDNKLFAELDRYESDIATLRGHNFHIVNHLSGRDKNTHKWIYVDEDGAEATSAATVGTRIGGRLDWPQLSAAVERLLPQLPSFYASEGA